ncbi:Type II secretion system (T2SS), protein E, N-terminal domain [Stigmatella aurantiaca]|uniref:Type II secretion system (T2SS), protein E, N-terminal domain n=1 Tax=Stigmatella aurantiaca TaxID=41 RepID=A0A1H7J362_STIAU|nr:general secretion pathway protein GspE [Stigmatella aurantiaca]SEK68622.1 Type II secretion system (T2SS), protein E, N-terminal domain [Stigmatella aurantiaca]
MLGEILLERGVVNRAQLRLGLVHHHEVRVPLGRALVREGICTESQVLQALSDQLGIDAVALEKERLEPKLARLIPTRIAQQYRIVPLRLEQRDREVLHVALPAPASIEALDAVRAISGKPRVEPHLASDTALSRALAVLYGIREPAREPLEAAPSPSDEAALLLYGWPPVTSVLMTRVLARHGYETRVVTPLEVFHAGPSDIVVAPMQAMEGLLMGEARLNSALIIHGDSDGEGFERAQALGARGFLANPLDEELLLRAIHRLRPPASRGLRPVIPRGAPAPDLLPG